MEISGGKNKKVVNRIVKEEVQARKLVVNLLANFAKNMNTELTDEDIRLLGYIGIYYMENRIYILTKILKDFENKLAVVDKEKQFWNLNGMNHFSTIDIPSYSKIVESYTIPVLYSLITEELKLYTSDMTDFNFDLSIKYIKDNSRIQISGRGYKIDTPKPKENNKVMTKK